MKVFHLLLNILWLVCCGLWMAIGYLIAALICFVLIVTIPFGIARCASPGSSSGRSAGPPWSGGTPVRGRSSAT